jgi:TonB family protein
MVKPTHQLKIAIATILVMGALQTLAIIALSVFLLSIVSPRVDAQWYWASGMAARGGVVVFPSSGITASGRTVVFERGNKPPLRADVIRSVQPEYPYDERINGHQGAGFFRMTIDPKTGLVKRVLVETSTGFKTLDDSVINAGLQWRWRPATWKELILSCHFQNWIDPRTKRLDEWRY